MEILLDPSIWVGLLTLIVLEIVLGIDNLVFVAILSDKLPVNQRDKARLIGLSLALFMRLALLSVMSWLVTLNTPLFYIDQLGFAGRELIMLLGGLFLLFKATVELHDRLENHDISEDSNRGFAGFWAVVIQIVILDAVFSLDAVITAVGMVSHLWIMMTAVVIAMGIMVLASRPLTEFVNAHPTVVVLCLSFLLMIGLSLIAEGFGFHIPKGYLYAAIGFSIIIELFNQISRRNFIRSQARRPMRERTAEAILRLVGGRQANTTTTKNLQEAPVATLNVPAEAFKDEERYMINGVLTLASRSIRSLMTPRGQISWVNASASLDDIRLQLLDTPHSLFPVCRDELDEIIGVVRAKELLVALQKGQDIAGVAALNPAIIVPETLDPINLLGVLRRAKGSIVIVSNEFGMVQGLVTPLDVLEAIAGEFPDEDETPDIVEDNGSWLVKGGTDLHSLEQRLEVYTLVDSSAAHASIAGLLMAKCGQLPNVGDVIDIGTLHFTIEQIDDYRIDRVRVVKEPLSDEGGKKHKDEQFRLN